MYVCHIKKIQGYNIIAFWITFVKLNLVNVSPVNTKKMESQITAWAITVVCGRGHQQIKRSQILMVLLFCIDTRPYVLSGRDMQQWHFFSLILPKQLRQCCSPRPYAVPMAILRSPHVSVRGNMKWTERRVWNQAMNAFKGMIFFCVVAWQTHERW